MLRRMLGDIQAPECLALMRLIETQSKQTLGAWATRYAKERYLPIYLRQRPKDQRLLEGTAQVERYLAGACKLSEIKPSLKAMRELAAALKNEPVAQAAARAVATGCAAVSTPTNALGFLFYGAAAVAYSKAGLTESAETYDALATQELRRAYDSLAACAVPGEPNPAKIDWHC